MVTKREKRKLPITSEVNPKKSVMAISMVSEGEREEEKSVGEEPKKEEKPSKEKRKKLMIEEPEHDKEERETRVQRKCISFHPKDEVKPYVPSISFPQLLKAQKVDDNFLKFLEMFKKLQVNISVIEAIAHMPH